MAIFGSGTQKKEQRSTISDSQSATLMTKCMEIHGDIKGCGSIHIDGIVHGDVEVEKSVVVGKTGKVFGNIQSKEIIISGEHQGTLQCEKLEVTQTGIVSHAVKAKELVSDGKIDALLDIDVKVHITQNGKVTTNKLESRHIVVNGLIEGNIVATELLEINKDGNVKGEMTVKKIKVAEGGLMLGTMLTYHKDENIKKVSKTMNNDKNKKEETEIQDHVKNEVKTSV